VIQTGFEVSVDAKNLCTARLMQLQFLSF